MKQTPLSRKAGLRRARRPVRDVAARAAWSTHPQWGRCEICGKRDQLLHPHHGVLAQTVRSVDPSREFDLENRILIGATCCHAAHHQFGVRDTRILLAKVPQRVIDFGREVLGRARADDHFRRRYRVAGDPPTRGAA